MVPEIKDAALALLRRLHDETQGDALGTVRAPTWRTACEVAEFLDGVTRAQVAALPEPETIIAQRDEVTRYAKALLDALDESALFRFDDGDAGQAAKTLGAAVSRMPVPQ